MQHTLKPGDKFLIVGSREGATVAMDSTDARFKAEQIAAAWRASGLLVFISEHVDIGEPGRAVQVA